ncbi:hypothetical protein [Streptomyces shenzhenensis]
MEFGQDRGSMVLTRAVPWKKVRIAAMSPLWLSEITSWTFSRPFAET